LTDIEQARLTKLTCSARAEHRLVLRARIVLAAAQQTSNAAIAAETGLHVDTVRKWRRRFCQHRIGGLTDRRRSGRPVSFTAVQVAEVKQLACTLPAETGVALSRWSSAELAGETMRRGVVTSISASTIRRWLTRDAIKPWQHRSWIFPRDPDFATKAARVLDLYARSWNGEPLGDNDYVISADELGRDEAR
jgi:transposase